MKHRKKKKAQIKPKKPDPPQPFRIEADKFKSDIRDIVLNDFSDLETKLSEIEKLNYRELDDGVVAPIKVVHNDDDNKKANAGTFVDIEQLLLDATIDKTDVNSYHPLKDGDSNQG